MHIDLFCQVVDNYGDIGVCWRLAQQLSQKKPVLSIRLFVDDLAAFQRIEPRVQPQLDQQKIANVAICAWSKAIRSQPANFVIEAFGCELPPAYVVQMPAYTQLWLNLEYLSAEPWVSELHGLPSPQANGIPKYFFFPGFTTQTGGLLRPQSSKNQRPTPSAAFWSRLNIDAPTTEAVAFVFSYPNAPLEALFDALSHDTVTWTVLLAATVPPPKNKSTLPNQSLSYLSQADFDILLDYAELNIVRGEDSFVRAIWAETPFIWQPYVQTEDTHLKKLAAWLDQTPFNSAVRRTMQTWSQNKVNASEFQQLLEQRLTWQQHCLEYAQQLSQHSDLATQLLDFFANKVKGVKINA